MEVINKYFKGDKVLWMVVIILTALSVLVVYSSTGTLAYRNHSGNTEYYLVKHLFILSLSFVLMYFIHKVDYKYYTLFSNKIIIYIVGILLLLTLITGSNINEASRWLVLPVINVSFQTSDLAKITLLMYLALQLTKKQENIKDLNISFLPMIIPVILICGLIFPANFSTAALLFLTSVTLMFIGRISIKHLMSLLGLCIIGLSLFIVVIFNFPEVGRFGTWKNRIENFTSGESEENYQSEHSKMAIANGIGFGKGPGNSNIKNFLPQAYSDFIYAIIIEEYGFVFGGIGVILLYLIILFRGIRIVKKVQQPYPAFLAIGLTLLLVFQAFVNMSVVVNIMPVTGQTLPLLSMGGSSIWFTSISIGIILSISREIDNKENSNYAIS